MFSNSRVNLPAVGSMISLFGVQGTVTIVEPHSDWYWSVEARTSEGDDIRLILPTNYRTDDGTYVGNV